ARAPTRGRRTTPSARAPSRTCRAGARTAPGRSCATPRTAASPEWGRGARSGPRRGSRSRSLKPAGLGHVPHLLDQLVDAHLGRPELSGHPPAVDDDHAFADLVHVEEVVVDEDARLAGVLDPAHE